MYDYGRAVEPCGYRHGSFLLGNFMEEKKSKRKLNTLDKYIIFCFAFIVIYTIVHTVIFAITGLEAKILDALVFGLVGSEILQCFLIKRFKFHEEAKLIFGRKNKNESVYDETEE